MLTALVGAVSLLGMAQVDEQALALSDKWLQGVGYLADQRAAITESREFEIKHGRTDDRSYHSEYEDKMKAAAASSIEPLSSSRAQ